MTRFVHYVLGSYFEVWLHGVPKPWRDRNVEEMRYWLQWPLAPQLIRALLPRMVRFLRAAGFWRGWDEEVYQAWRWSWRFWEPIETWAGTLGKTDRRRYLRMAAIDLLTGREDWT